MSFLSKQNVTATAKHEVGAFKKHQNTPLWRTAPKYHWHGHISCRTWAQHESSSVVEVSNLLLCETSTLHTFSWVGFEDWRGEVSGFELMVLAGRRTELVSFAFSRVEGVTEHSLPPAPLNEAAFIECSIREKPLPIPKKKEKGKKEGSCVW